MRASTRTFHRSFWLKAVAVALCTVAAAAASPAVAAPPAAADAIHNSYQLRQLPTADGEAPLLQVTHLGTPVAEKAILQAAGEGRHLAAAMTADGRRLAYLVREEGGLATLWTGSLRNAATPDQLVAEVDTLADIVGAFHWTASGTELAYSVLRGAARGDDEIMTEIWLAGADDEPWMVFAGHGHHELLGFREDGRMLLRGPDQAVATYDVETFKYEVEALTLSQRVAGATDPVVTQIPLEATNNADIVSGSSSTPSSIAPGGVASVRIRVYNNGSSTWTPGTLHRLGAEYQGFYNQVTWRDWNCNGYMNNPTDGRAYLCSNVYPGYNYDFYFNIQAPSSASGSIRLAVRMVQDGVQWFGESYYWNIPVSGGSGGCANSPLSTPNDKWKLEIWNNRYFNGGTVEQRYEYLSGGFNFNWGSGRPSNCTGNDNYAVRFSRSAYFPSSTTYTFTTTTDDGVRLWVDGVLIIDRWIDQAPTTYTANRYLGAGYHDLRMDYYENGGGAVAALSWSAGSSGYCPAGQYDLADYTIGDSPNARIFSRVQENNAVEEFAYIDGGFVGSLDRKFFIKNAAGDNWEELAFDGTYVYRYRDTTWGHLCTDGTNAPSYYRITDLDRSSFSKWVKRCMYVGETWESNINHAVWSGYKNWNNRCDHCSTCCEGENRNRVKVFAHHNTYTTIWGYPVSDVIEIGGYDASGNAVGDHFWYAKQYGLVGFKHIDPYSYQEVFHSGAYQIDGSGHAAPNRQTLCGE